MIQPFSLAPSNLPGKGTLACHTYGGKTILSQIHAQYPLKFIPVKYTNRLAAVYMLSYGGGIVSGDHFDINLNVDCGATLLILTQGHTKIFKDRAISDRAIQAQDCPLSPIPVQLPTSKRPGSVQTIIADVAPSGTLLILPDPVTCFQDSTFRSKQVLKLSDDTSQLVLLDWLTSGRHVRGEAWEFNHYSSRIDVRLNDRLVVRDHMVLEQDVNEKKSNGNTSLSAQLGPFSCYATLIIICDGISPLYASVQHMRHLAETERILPMRGQASPCLWSVSPLLGERGVLIRIAGKTTENVRDFVKYTCLSKGLLPLTGQGMFAKILI